MGMYNYVNFEAPCPSCGKTITDDWQTKDGNCMLEKVKIQEINTFYNYCDNCGEWIQYERKPANDINDFVMSHYHLENWKGK